MRATDIATIRIINIRAAFIRRIVDIITAYIVELVIETE
jgi:hypothetical protein